MAEGVAWKALLALLVAQGTLAAGANPFRRGLQAITGHSCVKEHGNGCVCPMH